MPIKISLNKPLKEYTTFKVGGLAKYFTTIQNCFRAVQALKFAKKYGLKIHLIGKGSNSIFDDRGFNGLVILNKIDFCHIHQNLVHVGGGYSFSHLGIKTAKQGLSGLEFASAIPASVGGAIFMNAGASQKQTFDCLQKVRYLSKRGKIIEYHKKDLEYGYRYSAFHKKEGIILDAIFELEKDTNSRKAQLDLLKYRVSTQPYDDPSAGCVFQNPTPKVSAAYLIDQCGLKGTTIGGVSVSKKHANFMINTGKATAKDILQLIEYVQSTVKANSGYDLKLEVRFIPYESESFSS